MASLRLDGVEKTYRDGDAETVALRGITLEVADGEILAVLGPSGCGKTTLLRVIAGLEKPERGAIFIGGRDVGREPPERRSIGFVFQRYALYQHMSAYANVAYGPRAHRLPHAEIERRVTHALRAMCVDEALWPRKPAALSGGQQQRVALARALAVEPGVLLLDEPLTGLDASLRAAVRVELALVQRNFGATMLFVTHDQSEALALGRRVAVMRDGAIEQVSAPRTLYERPASAFVAAFVGTPAMSLVQGEVSDGVFRARGGDLAFAMPELRAGPVTAGFRAESVRPREGGGEARGVVRAVEDFGSEAFVYVEGGFGSIVARYDAGAPALPVAGERIELALDASRAHFFDVESGRRLEAVATRA